MIVDGLLPLRFAVGDLELLPGNPRRGDVDSIARSLAAFGQRKPIVARRDGTVIAGNHTLQAARALGWDEVAVVFVDDDDATASAFALADNRTAELGDYDPQALADLISSVQDEALLSATGWTDADLVGLLESIAATQLPAMTGDPDAIPAAPPAKSVTGDVWLLGPHRVMCGDSTSPTDIDRLMAGRQAQSIVTDPPYGVDYGDTVEFRRSLGKTQRPADNSHVKNDGLSDALGLWAACFPLWIAVLRKKGSAFYCWGPGGDSQIDLGVALRDAGGKIHGSVIWVKSSFSFSRADHKYQHEPFWYGWRSDGTHEWCGPNNESSVWEYPKPSSSPDHPTQKPVELIRRCVRNITSPGGLTVDPFLGSGTSILAANLEGRVCFGMEMDPKYVDVICRRWQEATGVKPISEATGNEHDFCEARTDGEKEPAGKRSARTA